jgi:hypothetical protein
MIQLKRVRTKQAIPPAFRGDKRIKKALTLLVEGGEKREFDSGYWKKAKNQLKKESHGKCAYCEAPTATVAHGDVEHFRPKSVYWWLAYCYDNYLFSCQLCNQSFKSDNFPLAPAAQILPAPVPPTNMTDAQKASFASKMSPDPLELADTQLLADFAALCAGESALLVNPYFDEPEKHFKWEVHPVLPKVVIKAKCGASQAFYEAAEKFYGLNRDDLQFERGREYRKLSVFKNALQNSTIDMATKSEIENILRLMIADEAPFAGMCRYFVFEEWQIAL